MGRCFLKNKMELQVVVRNGMKGFMAGEVVFTCLHPHDIVECFEQAADENVYLLAIYRNGMVVDKITGVDDPSGGKAGVDCFLGLACYPLGSCHLQAEALEEGDTVVIEAEMPFARDVGTVQRWRYISEQSLKRYDFSKEKAVNNAEELEAWFEKTKPQWDALEAQIAQEPLPEVLRLCFMG